MNYLKEFFRLQAENEKCKKALERSSKTLRLALSTIMPDDKQIQDDVYSVIESCVEDFCEESHAIGYNDCLIEMAKHGAANEPVIYPNN